MREPLRSLAGAGLALALAGCHSSNDAPAPAPTCTASYVGPSLETVPLSDVGVYLDSSDPLLAPVASDLASYLSESWGGAVTVSRAAPDFSKSRTIWLSTSAAAATKAGVAIASGYAMERVTDPSGNVAIVVYARDAATLAAGAYALLETLGVRFFHPMQELVPHRTAPALPRALDVHRAPLTQVRGLQFHTLHPIEYFGTFNQPSPDHLVEAKRVIDWLVKTGQNYVQWALLSTVDYATLAPYAESILQYAHSRGVRVGAVVQLWAGSALQNNFDLVTDASKWQAEMDAQLADLMQVDWDVVEIGLGEFNGTDPTSIITWLSHATAQLATTNPSVEVNVQNHVGDYPSLWVPYQGQTYFYYQLPQFSDPRLGMSVHTLYFFDLYRDWAMYAHPDFHLQHDFLFQELPSRRVNYFPESAYWITADDSVPAFLPEYVLARLIDVQGLATEIAVKGTAPLYGHVTFSSGHEWGYWMNDYMTAKMLWDPGTTVDALFADYASAFGPCAGDIGGALGAFTDLQTKYLFDDRLAPYVMGEDTTIDLGFLANIETIPRRVQFEELLTMSEADRAAFESGVVDTLQALATQVQPLEDLMASRCATVDSDLAPWCDELWDGMAIVRLRVTHAALLYRAVLAYARQQSNAGAYLDEATATTAQAAKVIARRESQYRFDRTRLTGDYANPTIYSFGYLHQAHTQCYFTRREAQVQTILQTGAAAALFSLPGCNN